MEKPRLILALAGVAAFVLGGCRDPRPEAGQAKSDFSRLYPAAEVVGIRISEDEVVARSFAITYRRPGDPQTKVLEIQYMKNDLGVYELHPAPPAGLP